MIKLSAKQLRDIILEESFTRGKGLETEEFQELDEDDESSLSSDLESMMDLVKSGESLKSASHNIMSKATRETRPHAEKVIDSLGNYVKHKPGTPERQSAFQDVLARAKEFDKARNPNMSMTETKLREAIKFLIAEEVSTQQAKMKGPMSAFMGHLKSAQKSLGDVYQQTSDEASGRQVRVLFLTIKKMLDMIDTQMPELSYKEKKD